MSGVWPYIFCTLLVCLFVMKLRGMWEAPGVFHSFPRGDYCEFGKMVCSRVEPLGVSSRKWFDNRRASRSVTWGTYGDNETPNSTLCSTLLAKYDTLLYIFLYLEGFLLLWPSSIFLTNTWDTDLLWGLFSPTIPQVWVLLLCVSYHYLPQYRSLVDVFIYLFGADDLQEYGHDGTRYDNPNAYRYVVSYIFLPRRDIGTLSPNSSSSSSVPPAIGVVDLCRFLLWALLFVSELSGR